MTVFKLMLDKDKETKWLNEMAFKGYALVNFVAGFYTFEQCEPGMYTYQIDWTKGLWCVSDDYREFMKEIGVEIICLWGPWVILRKKTAEGPFELYSDAESQIQHYTKILMMFKAVTILEIICFFIEFISAKMGSNVGIFGMVLIGIICVAFINVTRNTKKNIIKLKKDAGLLEENQAKYNGPSPLLTTGLFLNMIGIFLNSHPEVNDIIKGFVIGIAIVFMLVGVVQTLNYVKQVNEEKEL